MTDNETHDLWCLERSDGSGIIYCSPDCPGNPYYVKGSK